jgi:hypothetical protein
LRVVPRLCELYPSISLTTEEKAHMIYTYTNERQLKNIQMKCLAKRLDVAFSLIKLGFNIQNANAVNKQNCDES